MIDDRADVVVVGAGPAGAAAAVAAADAGADVMVLEALGEIGGNAIWSTGYLAFCDFAMQHQAGVMDSPERFLDDASAEVDLQRERYGIVWDRTLTRRFAERSAATYDFLARHGVTFGRFIPRPRQHRTDRMVAVDDPRDLQRAFLAAFAERAIRVRYRTRARRLITHDEAVVGVVTTDDGGGRRSVEAASGVVLATGGYQAGVEVRRRYQPEHLATTPYLGIATCRGDGHVMGQRVGGDLLNMTMIQPLVIVGSALVEDSIAVNADGVRFHDEAGPYDDRVAALLAQPARRAFYVFDDTTASRKRQLVAQMPEPPVSAPSVEALAALLGVSASALGQTVASWNEQRAGSGSDPFGRVVFPADGRGIVEPPFHAGAMVLGTNFPSGGFRTTTAMAVVDVDGRPLRGLWAAGDTVGGVNPCLGLGGIHISSALTLGFVAGESAARGEVGEPHDLPAAHEPPPPKLAAPIPIVEVDEGS